MTIRWSPAAADDLEQIVEYISKDSWNSAERVAEAIYNRAASIRNHPYQGRSGRVQGTRELVLRPLAFILVYRVIPDSDAVEVVNITHGSQRWPI
jgi:addiction module RelE/StbE family toxin